MTLGTYPVPPLEMAQAGTVLADSGVLHPARFIISATVDGHLLLRDAGREAGRRPARGLHHEHDPEQRREPRH